METATALAETLATAPSYDPSLFVAVPETTLSNGMIVPSFMVSKFACSKGEDDKLTISASRKPWVSINYHDAVKASADAGFTLERESQRLALIQNVLSVPENWLSGVMGAGDFKRGIRNYNVSEGQAGDYIPTDPTEHRSLKLTNGEEIFDINGNVYNWIFDDIQGDEKGIISKKFNLDSPSINCPYPSSSHGMGWRPSAGSDWSGLALIRGGFWRSYDYAGVFCLDLGWPVGDGGLVGFRCTKSL